MPFPYVFGCDHLTDLATAAGRFLRPKSAADYATIRPGYLFLVRRNDLHWSHVGIVAAVRDGETMDSIEGNTIDSGSPEGFEVCRRTRGVKDEDFLIISKRGKGAGERSPAPFPARGTGDSLTTDPSR